MTKEQIIQEINEMLVELDEINTFAQDVSDKEKSLNDLKDEQRDMLSLEVEQEINSLETLLPKLKAKRQELKKNFKENNQNTVRRLRRDVQKYRKETLSNDARLNELKKDLKESISSVVNSIEELDTLFKTKDKAILKEFNDMGLHSLKVATGVDGYDYLYDTPTPLSHLSQNDEYFLKRLKDSIERL